jgi:hypothetical protein
MDTGTFGSTFSKVASYTDNSLQTTVTTGISAGNIYGFKFRA